MPVALLIGSVTYITLRAVESQLETYLKEDVQIVARALRRPVANAINEDDLSQASELIHSVLEISRFYGAYLYSSEGELILSAGQDRPSGKLKNPALKNPLKERGTYMNFQEQRVYSFSVPLSHRMVSGPMGFLQIVRKKSDIYSHLLSFRIASISIIGLVLALVLAVVSVFYRFLILSPVETLSESFNKLGAGEMKPIEQYGSSKEFNQLFTNFNKMTHKLKASELESQLRQKEKQELEKKLQQKEKLAAIGELSAGVAHELGNPLSVIDAKLQRSLRKGELDNGWPALCQDLKEETDKMTQIIQDLLSFARSRAEGLHLQSTSLKDLATGIKRSLKEVRGDSLTWLILDDDDVTLNTDPLRLNQVLTNIVKNAVEAVQSQTHPQVVVSWSVQNNYVLISIDDNGPGIPEELVNKVFEPFYSTKRPGKGTGLGLSVSYTLVSELGGDIEYKKSHLGGACYQLRFKNHQNQNDPEALA